MAVLKRSPLTHNPTSGILPLPKNKFLLLREIFAKNGSFAKVFKRLSENK
jgi:hypothetical protein